MSANNTELAAGSGDKADLEKITTPASSGFSTVNETEHSLYYDTIASLFAHSTVLYVVVYSLIGLSFLLIIVYGVRLIRNRMRTGRSRRRIAVRTSGVRSQRDLVELRRLERSDDNEEDEEADGNDDDDDDVTLFTNSKPTDHKSVRISMRNSSKRK